MTGPAPTTGRRSTLPRAAGLAAVADALPPRRVSSAEIASGASIASSASVDADWIIGRTGVHERRALESGQSLTELATDAATQALERAELAPEQLDLVLVATWTPDRLLPTASCELAARLETDALAIDLGAACNGFVSGLALATAQIEAGRAEHVLLVGADAMSRVVDYADKSTAGLFGDGAGAAVISAGGAGLIDQIRGGTDIEGLECLSASHEERLLRMDGRATFRAAVDRLSQLSVALLNDAGLAPDEVDLFVYHQANARITKAVGERLGLRREQVADYIAQTGNTSAASVPIALAQALEHGRIHDESRVLLAGFGAGFSWSGALLHWTREPRWKEPRQ